MAMTRDLGRENIDGHGERFRPREYKWPWTKV
jgi:hypothetical protein